MEGYFQYSNKQIRYTITGSGKVIVLLHGYLESIEAWTDFASKLAEKFTVICIDLPGHGLSGVYGETHTMEFMATAVNELLAGLGIKKIFLAGHSLGGYVTLAFLELFPDILTGYCLFHSHPFADQPATIEKRKMEIQYVKEGKKNIMYSLNIEKMFAAINLSRFPLQVKRLKELASKTPDYGITAMLNGMMARPSRAGVMEKGLVPCLWILGAMDSHIQHEEIPKKVNLPENTRVVVLKNSGHIGFIEEEAESLKAFTAFMDMVEY